MSRIQFINVLFLGIVLGLFVYGGFAADAPPAAAQASADESPAAKQASIRYQREVDAANQEFEAKVRQLRRDYDTKMTAARRSYSVGLKAAQAEETRKGRLEVAVAVKEAVARLEAEPAPTWPKQVLPDPVTTAGPHSSGTAQAGGNNGTTGKTIPASTGVLFDLTNEKKIREFWTLPTDTDDWQCVNRGLDLRGMDASPFMSRFTWTGDCTIEIAFVCHDNWGKPSITVFGEEILLPDLHGKYEFLYQVVIERRGDTMRAKINKDTYVINIKKENSIMPTRLELKFGQKGLLIRGIRIQAKELKVENDAFPGPNF